MKKSKLSNSGKTISKDVMNTLHKLKHSLCEGKDDVKNHAGDLVTDLLDELQSKRAGYQDELEEMVADKPLKSIGIAILVGIVLAKIIL